MSVRGRPEARDEAHTQRQAGDMKPHAASTPARATTRNATTSRALRPHGEMRPWCMRVTSFDRMIAFTETAQPPMNTSPCVQAGPRFPVSESFREKVEAPFRMKHHAPRRTSARAVLAAEYHERVGETESVSASVAWPCWTRAEATPLLTRRRRRRGCEPGRKGGAPMRRAGGPHRRRTPAPPPAASHPTAATHCHDAVVAEQEARKRPDGLRSVDMQRPRE